MTNVKITTSEGDLLVKLEDELTPKTVHNFLQYVDEGFYTNTLFHRVIKDFMVQGGGFKTGMAAQTAKAPIENEAALGLKNTLGTLSMARLPDPHSASSQFFINVAHNSFLDFKAPTADKFGYCAFGTVIEGLDVLQRMATVPTTTRAGHSDVPVKDLLIVRIERI
ncbi:MAG: peptidylprolyl isomerase [Gammaproteobacteria bacterium]|nr:peptidylprolyl isomerase [Gammaproteobacteria bacterium]MBP9728814.1 peptidylprolyl isomerase [Gammaproteobacteria bacterium]